MGRIVASVKIENLTDQDGKIRCDALVDTGASYMVLPSVWRDRLGELDEIITVPLETATATQETVEGKICGPVRIQIEGFPSGGMKFDNVTQWLRIDCDSSPAD